MSLLKTDDAERLVGDIIRGNVDDDAVRWLQEKGEQIRQEAGASVLNQAFGLVPRKCGRQAVQLVAGQKPGADSLSKGWSVDGWSTDRLCRAWLLMQVDSTDETRYLAKINNLFKAAEMNEQVALYSSLPLLHYPGQWRLRCAEGIRTNIGTVLEAIMYNNPYPAEYLEMPQWNQMILKAFFTEKDVNRIVGLDERANPQLASILVDYAHERWAAHRSVNHLLWRLVAKYIDEAHFTDLKNLFNTGTDKEKKAAALAFSESDYAPAMQLLNTVPAYLEAIQKGQLNWNTI